MGRSRNVLFWSAILVWLAISLFQPSPAAQASPSADDSTQGVCENCRVFLPLISRNYIPPTCLNSEEEALSNLINAYRSEKGLPPIPLSQSLTHVAQAHVRDLYENRPDTGNCNLHSWSNKGSWTPVCYTADHRNARGMWEKPKEITGGIYTAYGFEIAYWHSAQATAAAAFDLWKQSGSHNPIIVEENIWKGMNWRAMGIGIYQNYAVVWFGQADDPLGSVSACNR